MCVNLLCRDGVWDRDEIEAIYGVHHIYSQKKSKVQCPPFTSIIALLISIAIQDDVEHQKKADYIVTSILELMDTDKDGKITPEEFEKVGYKGLPNFDNMGAEGHHYDVESGTFNLES